MTTASNLYLKLFHGRATPNQEMNDWGADGPVFGPLSFVHTTYATRIHLGAPDELGDTLGDLFIVDDLVFYDGMFYGDWSAFAEQYLDAELRARIVEFDEVKADLPSRTVPAMPVQLDQTRNSRRASPATPKLKRISDYIRGLVRKLAGVEVLDDSTVDQKFVDFATKRKRDVLEKPTDFFAAYTPIKNHLDADAPADGYMFETYGAELSFVRAQPPATVWTLLDADGTLYVQAGYHHVNRIGYFVTTTPAGRPDESYQY